MEGKLIKQEDGYYALYNAEGIFISDVNGGSLANRLSLKNCQAIENGYDLDELAKIEYPICEVWNDEESLIRELAFKKGFQKALEILGDKKFSLDDMKEAYGRGFLQQGVKSFNSFIQSLQQTEWDVEIVMDICGDKVYAVPEPALDENGCLILKKK